MKFKLGSTGEDVVTGFSGAMTGFASYLTGCDQYLLAPKVKKDGSHTEGRWFDENRIKIKKTKIIKIKTSKDDGACEMAPIK